MRLILVAVLLSGVAWGQGQQRARPPAPGTAAQIAASDYHAACMDEAEIEARGTQPMGPVLAQIAALQNNRQIPGVLAALERVGIGALFPAAGPGAGTLPVRTPAYRGYMERLFTLLGDSPQQAAQETEAAIQIGVGLARAQEPGPHSRLQLADLKRLAPNFNWTAYFDGLGVPSSAGVAASEAYVQALNGMVLLTPIESWKSYLRARWLDASSALLSPTFVSAHDAFYGHSYEHGAAPTRPQRCQRQQSRFTPQQFSAVEITRNDYFADTMRLRAVRFAMAESRSLP